MKKRMLATVFLFVLSTVLLIPASADTGKLNTEWWPQPGSYAVGQFEEAWMEKDGMLVMDQYDEGKIVTIATAFGGADPSTIKDIDLTYEFTIPDAEETNEGWAGLYLRSEQPQTGAGGVVIHLNSNGLGILDNNTNSLTIEERVFPEAVYVNDFNKMHLVLKEKNLTITLNGVEIYKTDNCYPVAGFVGFSAIGFPMQIRNVSALVNDAAEPYTAYTVEGTSVPDISVAPVESEAEESSAAPTKGNNSSTTKVTVAPPVSDSDGPSTGLIVGIVIGVVVAAGIVAAVIVVSKKKKASK